MRLRRILFILTAFYFVFIGGTAYYDLIPGVRFFHHAFVTLLLSLWLIGRIRSGQGLPRTPLDFPLYAAVVVWFASAVMSIYPRMALENLWFPITHTVIFFIIAGMLQQGRHKIVIETQYILATMVIFITGLELASWYFGLGILPGTDIGWTDVGGVPLVMRRVSLAMNISTLLAGYVAPLVTITFAWALTMRQAGQRVAFFIFSGLLLLVLILTFSRGGLLSLALAGGVFIAFQLARSERFSAYISMRLFAGLVIIAGIGVLTLFIVYTVSQDRRSGDEGRVDMWLSAILITRDHPVLGAGPGLFGRAFRDYRDVSIARDKLAAAHNVYLNTAAETGVTGVLVSLGLLVALLRGWWKQWRSAAEANERIRLEAALAALIGLGVHSLVDTFTITPIVLLILGLAAFCVTGQRSILDQPPPGRKIPAVIALIIVVGYGIWFALQVDPAYSRYLNSLNGDLDQRLQEANAAAEIDPELNLYDLQIAYITGLQAANDPAKTEAAIAGYQTALALEPTWDLGWMNLAALELRRDNQLAGMVALTEAQRINPLTVAPLNRAKLAEAEDLLPRTPIITAYSVAIMNEVTRNRLPLAAFWVATPLREAALDQYLQTADLEIQYRVQAVHHPEKLVALLPAEPHTAQEWWVTGEYALTVENNVSAAVEAFTQAIQMDRTNGDYYASRARANLTLDPASASRDLDYAALLGTKYEYPNAIRAEQASTSEERLDWWAKALPPVNIGQEFAAVLYGGRVSGFDLLPELRPPGPGNTAMQPWYWVAEQFEGEGRYEAAIRAYQVILNYAPDEIEAQTRLDQLRAP